MAGNRRGHAGSVSGSVVAPLRWTLLALSCLLSAPVLSGTPPTITFTPAHPTTRDMINAFLSVPDCGSTTTFVVSGAQITISTSPPTFCGTPPPVTLATLGALPAGSYQVQWFEAQVLTATAPLVVTAAADPTPLLQPWALLLVVAGCGALAFAKLRNSASAS